MAAPNTDDVSKTESFKDPLETVSVSKPRKWYHWFDESDTPEERRLIWKLDCTIVLYSVVIYWLKYVSGMSEDLNFKGNQLVQFQTMYTVGAVVGQLPAMWFFAKVPMNIFIPGTDVLWGIVTLLQYRTSSYGEMMAYRFLVGWLEGTFFPGVHWVLGSWYRRDEIGRRGGFWYVGVPLGQLTAGLVQASVLKHLEGHLGLRAWRWNFIICAIMTIPVGLAGFFIWPGTPDKGYSFFLSKADYALARKRLERVGNKNEVGNPFTWAKIKKVFSGWKVYVLTIWAILFWNTSANSAAYLLWLKSVYGKTGPALEHANNLSTTAPGIGIALVILINFGGDLFRSQWGAITIANSGLLIGLLMLTAPHLSKAGHFLAYNLMPFSYSQSSTLYGWSNIILRRDQEERAIVLIVMNSMAQASTAWIPLLTYPTVEAPRFLRGFIFSSIVTFLQILFTQIVRYLSNRDEILYARLRSETDSPNSDTGSKASEQREPGTILSAVAEAEYATMTKT